MANWPRVDANDLAGAARLRRAEPRRRLHLRAGLDVQGVHRRRRAARTAWSRPTRTFDLPPQIQVADRTIDEPHARGTETLTHGRRSSPSPRNVGAITIGLRDGHASASTTGCARFGFGQPTGVDLPGEERGHRACRSTSTRAPRWATCRSARASRSRRCRWPPAYAAIANGGILRPPQRSCAGRRQARRRAAGPARDHLADDRRRSCATMLEGVLAPGRHRAARSRSPATSWRARPARRTRSTRRPASYSKTNYVASFVGFAPARDPQLLVAVMVDEPQGAIYGGAVAAPGVRQDRRVRAAVPADPARR